MPKVAFEIPSEIKDLMSRHSEINWDKIISDTLWGYAKRLKLLDSIAGKSKLTEKDVEEMDHAIKAEVLKKYQIA